MLCYLVNRKIKLVTIITCLFITNSNIISSIGDSLVTYDSSEVYGDAITPEKIYHGNKEEENSALVNYGQPCQLVPVMHLIEHDGCRPKALDSFACQGSCPSYTQISPKKLWEYERLCTCCQPTSKTETTFTLDCPQLDPPYRKVKALLPLDCICRSCRSEQYVVEAKELVDAMKLLSG